MKNFFGKIILILIFSASIFAGASDEVIPPNCRTALGRLTKTVKFAFEVLDFAEKIPFAVTVRVWDTKESRKMGQHVVDGLLLRGLKAENIGPLQHSSVGTSVEVTINDPDSYHRFINYALEEQNQSRVPYVEGYDFVKLTKN